MALTSSSADAAAQAFCAAAGITDSTAIAKWQSVWETIYTHLLTDLTATLEPSSVTTVGSATTQIGPATPVPLVIA